MRQVSFDSASVYAHAMRTLAPDFCGLNKFCASGRRKHIFTDLRKI